MQIKTLLIVGAVKPGAIENFYSTGFKAQGIQVDRFNSWDRYVDSIRKTPLHAMLNKLSPAIFFKAINDDLKRFIAKKRYDAILVFKGMDIFPETLSHLKERTRVLANYNGDHPFLFFFSGTGNKNVTDGIPLYDVHFSYSASIVERLRKECNKIAYRIPFGYDSSITLSSQPAPQFENRFVFIGAYDQERAAYLDELKNPSVHIYGDDRWKTRTRLRPYLRQAYQNSSLYGNDYMQAIHESAGVLNLLRQQNIIEGSHNMRTFEVPGFHGLLISQRTDEQQEFFEEDKEAIYFDSKEELNTKLRFLSTHPQLVRSIKQAAHYRAVRSEYSYNSRSKQLITFLNSLD